MTLKGHFYITFSLQKFCIKWQKFEYGTKFASFKEFLYHEMKPEIQVSVFRKTDGYENDNVQLL